MKKIIITFLGVCLVTTSFSQDMPEKKVQAGIVLGSGMNFQKMGTKKLESAGVGGIFTVGANANIRMGENIALNTGLEFDFSGWRYNAVGNQTYYRYDDTQILQYKESNNAGAYNTDNNLSATAVLPFTTALNAGAFDTTETIFRLDERKHKMIYATIPLMFTFRTDYFGDFRYYGKFGMRTSFALSSKIDDKGAEMIDDNLGNITPRSAENLNMKAKNEVFFLKAAVGLGGGAEWKFSGNTSLFAEVGFYYGVTPLHVTRNADKPDNNHLYNNTDIDKDGKAETNSYFAAKAGQTQLLFKFGILF
jgi:hypothetical protein